MTTSKSQAAETRRAKRIYRSLTGNANVVHTPESTKPSLDQEVTKIFEQASSHREILIRFYILYTWVFSIFVAGLIIAQVTTRVYQDPTIEVVPQWALNLLIVGMFGQFISLLRIITDRVWTFDSFLRLHSTNKSKK